LFWGLYQNKRLKLILKTCTENTVLPYLGKYHSTARYFCNLFGLQLCDANASSSYGAAQCNSKGGGCQGSSGNYCYPNHIWSGSLLETGYYRVL